MLDRPAALPSVEALTDMRPAATTCGAATGHEAMRLRRSQEETRRRQSPTDPIGAPMNTRTIAILALVIAVILVIVLFVV